MFFLLARFCGIYLFLVFLPSTEVGQEMDTLYFLLKFLMEANRAIIYRERFKTNVASVKVTFADIPSTIFRGKAEFKDGVSCPIVLDNAFTMSLSREVM